MDYIVELSRGYSDEVGEPQHHIEETSSPALVTDIHSSDFKLNISSLEKLSLIPMFG